MISDRWRRLNGGRVAMVTSLLGEASCYFMFLRILAHTLQIHIGEKLKGGGGGVGSNGERQKIIRNDFLLNPSIYTHIPKSVNLIGFVLHRTTFWHPLKQHQQWNVKGRSPIFKMYNLISFYLSEKDFCAPDGTIRYDDTMDDTMIWYDGQR